MWSTWGSDKVDVSVISLFTLKLLVYILNLTSILIYLYFGIDCVMHRLNQCVIVKSGKNMLLESNSEEKQKAFEYVFKNTCLTHVFSKSLS